MNNILTGITGYFSKSLILGTLLPVSVFTTLAWLLAVPLLPPAPPSLKPLEALDPQWKLLGFTLAVIVLSGLLHNINNPLIRLYEGYPWADLWIGRRRKEHHRRRFRALKAQWEGTPWLLYRLTQSRPQDPRIKQIKEKGDAAGRALRTDFPGEEDLVLPTRLGNAIRSFEYYTKPQYKIEAVTIWPRLVAKIDKDYAAGIEDSKITFDFMLNCAALSSVLAFLLLAAGLLYPLPLASARAGVLWVSQIAAFCGVSHFFYSLSISRAKTWGNTVKGAFDLYRWDLLKQLGYSRMPRTVDEERALWHNITQRIIFGDQDQLPAVEYYPRTTYVQSRPDFVRLELLRAIDEPGADGEIIVKLHVENKDIYDVTKLVVTDTLPDGFQYLWDSAAAQRDPAANAQPISVTGTNPYLFAVGDLKRGQKLLLTYRALEVGKEVKKAEGGPPAEKRVAVDFRWVDNDPPVGAVEGEQR